MRILTVFVLASFALPVFAVNKTCTLSAAAQRKHEVAPLNKEMSYQGLEARYAELMLPTAYNVQTNTLELGMQSAQGNALEDSVHFQILGSEDCSTKFVNITASENRGADGEAADSDLEIAEALQGFARRSQQICDSLNVSDQGQSKIEIQNDSTTSGFFFGTGERVHLEFNARCIIQD